jgi:resuscitation-promoting factor RpfA
VNGLIEMVIPLRTSAAGLAAITAATVLWPDWGRVAEDLRALPAALEVRGADRVLVDVTGAFLWAIATWVAVGLVAAGVMKVPGRAGRAARRIAERMLPAAVMRLLGGAAGLSIALTPSAAMAVSAPSPAVPPPPAAMAVSWPTDHGPAPVVSWPVDPTSTKRAPNIPADGAAGPHSGSPVTVTAGDTLWGIAARQLPGKPSEAQIAAAWPRWYARNRTVIGADPSLIRPAQVLQPPE